MIRDSSSGYGIVTILFHWVTAVVTLLIFGLGIYLIHFGGYSSPNFLKIAHFHYAMGSLLFGWVAIRLVWRLSSKTPVALAKPLSARIIIKLIKFILYVLLFAIIITGYLTCTYEGQTVDVFGLFQIPSLIFLDNNQLNIVSLAHKYLSWVLIVIVVIHAAAALIHHFVVKDKTLIRMIKPGMKD
jgi:cytochrome b561